MLQPTNIAKILGKQYQEIPLRSNFEGYIEMNVLRI